MINKLSTALKCSGAMTIALVMVVASRANSTEYVFSAPPEVDKNVAEEIPAQEVDYPFYECDVEASEKGEMVTDEDNNTKIDSHDCDCIDCGEVTSEQEAEQTKLNSLNKQKRY